MRLFAKYNRVNVISTVIIFLIGCAAFSVLLRYVIISQIDEDLKIEKNEIETYVHHFNHLPNIIEVHDQYTTYKPINAPGKNDNKIFTHTVYVSTGNHSELQRTIAFDINTASTWYFVTVSKSLAGTDALIKTILAITISLILLILVVSFLINRIVLKKLWRPFYSSLQTVQKFELNSKQSINFNKTNIDEFTDLNSILSDSLNKAQQDYQSLKEFTENASHELQTPLAVIQSKLDILIQNEKLSEAESQSIQSAYHALQNLSKLNQSLLLLAKIENKQFSEQTTVDVKQLLENKINQFSDLWKGRNIKLQQDIHDRKITGNFYLTEILINNLLSNATKHNINNGCIKLLLNNELVISNTGAAHSLDQKQLFKRFYTQNNSTVSHGLGLSIVEQICNVSGFTCTYNFETPNIHTFKIGW